jgi:ATP-binding cassette subfamily C protein
LKSTAGSFLNALTHKRQQELRSHDIKKQAAQPAARRHGHATWSTAVAVTGVFSIFLALIQLALPLYTMQVYDRVLGSRSMETLAMLSLLAVGCFIVFGLLDAIRAKVYLAIGHFTAKTLSVEALETSMRGLLRGGQNRPSQVLRDFSELRQFLSGPSIAVPFDAALSLIFLAILYLIHPIYGIVAFVSALALVAVSLLGR